MIYLRPHNLWTEPKIRKPVPTSGTVLLLLYHTEYDDGLP